MVVVEIFEDKEHFIRAFRFEGHAKTAPYGEDIVCAAISVLSQTTVISLDHHLEKPLEIEITEGILSCTLPKDLNSKEQELVQIILKTMELGLEALKPQYGEYFKVIKRRWTEC